MLAELLQDVSLFRILHQIDQDLEPWHASVPCAHIVIPRFIKLPIPESHEVAQTAYQKNIVFG